MKISKIITAGLALVSAMCINTAVFAEKDEIAVMVDNEAVVFDQAPIIKYDRTLVPIRAVFEKAGAKVDWDGNTLTATITGKGHTVQISVGNNYMFKDGKMISLDVPAEVFNDRILIPVRAISEAMDYGVTWNGYLSTVLIATDNVPYRAFVGINRGFKDIKDISEFYIEQDCSNLSVDLNGDGNNEIIDFKRTIDLSGQSSGVFLVNGIDYTYELSVNCASVDGFAVVNASNTGDKLLAVIENTDVRVAHFYTFNGMTLNEVKDKNGASASIMYKKNLMFDGVKFAVSDLYGICCTDIMITGSYFQFTDNVMGFYRLSGVENVIPRTLVVSHNDDMLFRQITTDNYVEGGYKDATAFDLINSSQLTSFTLLDMYVDKADPSYTEFFIETQDGEKFVLIPYCV